VKESIHSEEVGNLDKKSVSKVLCLVLYEESTYRQNVFREAKFHKLCVWQEGWILIWLITDLIAAQANRFSSFFIVQLETPIDLALPALYSFSIVGQINSGFFVILMLITYYKIINVISKQSTKSKGFETAIGMTLTSMRWRLLSPRRKGISWVQWSVL
jgi:hypothetical protein